MDEPTAIAAPEAAADPCPRCGRNVGDAWLVCAWCGESIAAAAELAVGATLADGRYQVLGVIGRGGFGITYEMGDRRLQRRVAVKELFPESAVRHGSMVLTPPQGRAGFRAARDRFLREARVLARFTHPGIVRVYEVFEEHGTAYLVMELLDGRTLVELLRRRGTPFSQDEVLDVAGRVAAALRPVHAAGVLHRDINPSNIMLTRHGRIVVIDFGLARDFAPDQTVGMTRVVTPGYAPIEQYRGEARFGPSTDVYGLAATCYRLATGRVPVAAVERDGGAPLPSLRSANPDIDKAVSDAIADGLELEPTHRPQDLDAFLARLGVRRLPDGPRSILLDAVGMPAPPEGPTVAAPWPARAGGPPGGDGAQVDRAGGAGGAHRDVREGTEPPLRALDAAGGAEGDDHTVVVRGGAAPVDPSRPAPPAPPRRRPVTAPTRRADPLDRHADAAARAADADRTRADGPNQAAGWTGAGEAATAVPAAAMPDTRLAAGTHVLPAETRPRLTRASAVPGAGSRLPVAVGPDRPGRRKVTIPLAAVAIAAGAAAPVAVTAVVVLVALPWLATFGDSVAHRLRSAHGVGGGWAERRLSAGALAPARFVRNLLMSVLRTSPLIGIGAVLIGAWYALGKTSLDVDVLDLVLRAIGALVVGLIVITSREGSPRFRTGLGLDEIVRRGLPDGRTSERVVVGWLVAALLVAGALWLAPDPFPLP